MRSKIGIQLLTSEPQTRQAVLTALESSSSLEVSGTSSGLEEFKARLQERPVQAALIDIDSGPREALQDLERIARRFASTRFVVLSSRLESGLVIEAMQAGARHFLQKGSIGPDLADVLQRLIPEEAASVEQEGALVAVLSASGGSGATLIAVNLAYELQLFAAQSTLIVDLDWAYGAVSSYLDVKGQFGVADLLASGGRIDPELIRSTAVARYEHLHVLLSPAAIDYSQVQQWSHDALSEVLHASRKAYVHTVVDAPRLPAEIAGRLATASDATLIVFQLTVKDLHRARTVVQSLTSAGVRQDRLLGLVSRHTRKSPLVSLEDARKALQGLQIETISNDYRGANTSLNYGLPLAQVVSKSPLRKDIKALADRLRARTASKA